MDRKPNKIEVTVFDDENQLIGLIDFIRKAAAPGHSFIVVVDPDMSKADGGNRTFSIDGDGAFYIKDVKLNGQKVNTDDDGKLLENYLRKIQ